MLARVMAKQGKVEDALLQLSAAAAFDDELSLLPIEIAVLKPHTDQLADLLRRESKQRRGMLRPKQLLLGAGF